MVNFRVQEPISGEMVKDITESTSKVSNMDKGI